MSHLRILQHVAAQLSGKLDSEQVLAEILDLATTVLGATDGALSLIDENDPSTLVLRFGVGVHATRIGFRTKTTEGAIGEVWKTGEVFMVENYHQWAGRVDDSRMSNLTTSISAPLRIDNSLAGVIQLSWSDSVHSLSIDEVTSFQQFSLLASMALTSATVFHRLSSEIEDRKIAQQRLDSEKMIVDSIFNSVPGLIYLYNQQGLLVRWNRKLQDITGYSDEELINIHYLDWFKWNNDTTQYVTRQIERAFVDGFAEAEAEIEVKGGARRSMYLTAVPVPIEGQSYIVGIGIDITDRRQATRALAQVEEKFQNIIDSSPLGVHLYRLDFDDRLILIHANQTADHMLNISHRNLIDLTMEEAFPALAGTSVPDMYRCIAKGELSTQTFEIPYADERVTGTYFVTVFGIGHNEVVALFMDISERKKLEDEIRLHRDRLEALVEERTADLVAANEELTAMNEEITAINVLLEDSNKHLEEQIAIRRQKEKDLLLREKQYHAASALLITPSAVKDDQLTAVVRDALSLVKAPAGYIGLYERDTHTFDISHAIGPAEVFVMGPRSADKGMLGEVYRSGAVLYVEDYRLYEKRLSDPRLSRISSIIMIPLKSDDNVLGVLAATWLDAPRTLTEEEIEVLRQYGILVSAVLEKNNTQNFMTRQNLLLQGLAETTAVLMDELDLDAVLQNILAKAMDLAKIPHGFILMINENDVHNVFFKAGQGRYADRVSTHQIWRGGVFGEVLRTGQLVLVEDYQNWPFRDPDSAKSGVTMSMHAPLKVDGKIIGIIGLTAFGESVIISPEKLDAFKQFASIASIAVKNALYHEEFRNLAYHDTLTGLPNRASLNLRLSSELEKSLQNNHCGTLFFIDLDDLKIVNDTFGHSFGDNVITAASRHILETVGNEAFVSRIGGDEFVVILPGETNKNAVAAVADKLVNALSKEHEISGQSIHMSASIGVTLYPEDGKTPNDILKNADSAMYAAKNAGRNCWRFYQSSLSLETYERMVLTNSLRRALERNEFYLQYQPKIKADDLNIVGFEALLRWNSPDHGLVPPTRFIPYAEQSGLIESIGYWVLSEACRFARRLADNHMENIRVAVNISPRQLAADDFVERVGECVATAGIKTSQIEIEVTENVLIESMDDSIKKLELLQKKGIHIALDDFGTGYSSLTYLMRLPVGTLKIDKSFIDRILVDEYQSRFVGFIVDMAHTLGLTVVAEGVETQEQLSHLSNAGCDCIQGYVFSRPVAEQDALELRVTS